MKIALIATPFPLEEAPSPPLGLSYVASSFRAAGAEVILLDYIVEKYTPEKMQQVLDAFQPDAVGINSVTMNFKKAASIIGDVKRCYPHVVTIFGGPHVTFDAENTLRKYPAVDIVALGEAELTIRDLTPVLLQPERWAEVEGIAFLKEGKLVNNGRREFIKDLNTLPLPARDLLPVARYRALGFPVSIITSRGCPYRCIFCQGTRMVGHKIRYRETNGIVDEIEQILSLGFSRINIADDFFTSSRKQVRALCDEIKRRNLKFTWSAFARVNSVNHELLEMMMEVGCDAISFGIESGNQEMLDRVEKHMSLDQARKAIKICKDVGMQVFSSFIVGLPGETIETLRETAAFAKELDAAYGYHFLAPLPGTPVRDEVEKYDVNILSTDWDQYDANRAIVSTSKLSAQEMEAFVAEYDAECQKAWQQTEDAYNNGTATPLEVLSWEGRHHMELVYRMLSEDVIETVAQNLPLKSQQEQLQLLADRIQAHSGFDRAIVERTVNHLVRDGNLDQCEQAGVVNWYWPQYPVMPRTQPAAQPLYAS
jgi:radical SAM superfamily enzyme YgiQ (UPF0313 family)